MPNDKLHDEQGRLAALTRYDILDTAPECGFDTITELVRTVLRVPISAISLLDGDRQWFKSRAGLEATETPRDVAFCNHTIRQPGPLIVPDASQDLRFCENPLVTGDPYIASYAGVPLRSPDGYTIGSLCAIDTKPRVYDPMQIEVLERLADLVVEHLELRSLAKRDSLTGALTRRAFTADLDKAVSLFGRQQRPAALIMIDIDHFKQINDRYGHPTGDKAIQAVAALCERGRRPSDSFGRLGGEEFGLLLPETSEADAISVARRLCKAIGELEVPDTPSIRLTASFGVATIGFDRVSREAWMEAADAGLYAAKHTGRNRVCVTPAAVGKAA